jgi:toxin FitB
MYILDTNVVSELRKGKKANQNVTKWAQSIPVARLYISAISILELEIGILLTEGREHVQGAVLRAWTDGHVLPTFSGRILAIDAIVESDTRPCTFQIRVAIVTPSLRRLH